MEKAWATSGVDLHLELPRDPAAGDVTAPSGNTGPSGGVRARLEAALRDAVRSGRLGPGVRLPSSRALAADQIGRAHV